MTGGRLKRVRSYLGDETLLLTYGDGVADVDIGAPDRLPPRPRQAGHGHRGAAARPVRRARASTATRVHGVHRKAAGDGGWINGGFFVLEPGVLDYIDGDETSLGARAAGTARAPTASSWPIGTTASGSRMDTLRDKRLLESSGAR